MQNHTFVADVMSGLHIYKKQAFSELINTFLHFKLKKYIKL